MEAVDCRKTKYFWKLTGFSFSLSSDGYVSYSQTDVSLEKSKEMPLYVLCVDWKKMHNQKAESEFYSADIAEDLSLG